MVPLVGDSDSAGTDQSSAILTGSVTKGPLSPIEREGGPPAFSGVPGARIDIETAQGSRLTSAVTDPRGNYEVRLPPGTYKLTMPSLHGAMFAKDLPATITIAAGTVKRVDIHLDTGIR
jgi:hypothetical protein